MFVGVGRGGEWCKGGHVALANSIQLRKLGPKIVLFGLKKRLNSETILNSTVGAKIKMLFMVRPWHCHASVTNPHH